MLPVVVIKALIILHPDNFADIYINDFDERTRVRVTRDVAAGEIVRTNDISELVDLTFPDIPIDKGDALVYILREGWRFGLYFDFSRELDLETLPRELASLKSKLLFHSAQAELEAARIRGNFAIFALTEGKTDSEHVRTAKSKLTITLPIEFSKSETDLGGPMLLQMCEYYSKMPHSTKVVFIFDRDDPNIMKTLDARTRKWEPFQRWGNNVYSFMLPLPAHRTDATNVCIELYYKDDEITRVDKDGRRLFLSTEFDGASLKLRSDPKIHVIHRNKIKEGRFIVNDSGVFDERGSCALSKSRFAELVATEADNFSGFDFSEFQKVFDVLVAILKDQPEE